MEDGPQRVRLFVGGLGPSVAASDLERAFGSLGAVLSVELIRSKDRDFAYVDFEAASGAVLRKVFSAYKGCKWKGGCLRVEKSKESYLSRLQREWATDATKPELDVKVEKAKPKFNPLQDLKLFFPRLRKLKSVPARGTGKHKYSFQRCDSLPLAGLTLCGCGEHENEAVDPFDFEHDAYLRLVQKLEGNQADHPSRDEDIEKESQKMVKSETPERRKIEAGRKKIRKLSKRKNRRGKTEEEVKAIVEDALKDEEVPEDQSEEASQDEDGVTVPGIMKRKTQAKTTAPDNKWNKMFEAAAGFAETEAEEDNLFGKEGTAKDSFPDKARDRKRKKVKFAEEPPAAKLPKNRSEDVVANAEGENEEDKATSSGTTAEAAADKDERNKDSENQTQWRQVSSWTSLVGDGGGASFSLTGAVASKPRAISPAVDWGIAKLNNKEATGTNRKKGTVRTEHKADQTGAEKQQQQPQQIETTPPSVQSLLEKQTCSFMRSSNAEEEWLASRDKLRLDYKAKHRAAMRTKRKLQ